MTRDELLASVARASEESSTQSPTQSVDPVDRLVGVLGMRPLSAAKLRDPRPIQHRHSFRHNCLRRALDREVIEQTIPGKAS